jgi:hypothetical protein
LTKLDGHPLRFLKGLKGSGSYRSLLARAGDKAGASLGLDLSGNILSVLEKGIDLEVVER